MTLPFYICIDMREFYLVKYVAMTIQKTVSLLGLEIDVVVLYHTPPLVLRPVVMVGI